MENQARWRPSRGLRQSRGSNSWDPPQHQGGDNNTYPPDWTEGSPETTAYSQLDAAAKEILLYEEGYLFGVRVDSNDGPRRSLRQAAQRTSTHPLRLHEINNIDSEVTTTENARDANYVQKGWSLAAISDRSPWTLSRIARNNQANSSSRSITKYVLLQKLRVDLSPGDLSPVQELEQAFKEALGKPTRFEKSQAVYHIFELWGDLIPLVFDIGISLAVTDSESVARNSLTDRSYLGLQQLSMSASARPATQGGDPTTLQNEDNVRAWLRKPVSPTQWRQVRIIRATHLTTILKPELQSELMNLHQSLTTYCPLTTETITSNGTSFDGTSHAFGTISKVSLYSDGHYIKTLSVEYTTESFPVKYGAEQKPNNDFALSPGEHITDVTIWKDHKGVCGIQMHTNRGKTSKHFGSDGGSPMILRSSGGCLSGFSGIVHSNMIHDLQTIWRHDVQGPGISGDREFSKYYGGVAGTPFSDWPSVQHSDSAHIRRIRVKCGAYIDGIQASKWPILFGIRITYEDSSPRGRGVTTQEANYHGGQASGGREHFFHLEPNEHIVAVLGRYKNYIVQLCFVTNRGRTSDIFGGGGGEDFRCQAPATSDGRATRLHYICGKSGDWLNGILFAWAPIQPN